jgi:predicted alpha/beta-hydrolase family hydrolase
MEPSWHVPDDVLEIDTPHGIARAHLRRAEGPVAALLLGHGAGGSIDAPDLLATTTAAVEAGVSVARIEQPYRVAGRRSAAPAKQLDAAWLAVHAALTAAGEAPLAGLPTLSGGRSSGARVACRTAAQTGAIGVLCLAFPLHPPQRDPAAEPKTRLPELEAAGVPVLVVQGRTDRFGMPPAAPGREVVQVTGDHGLKADVPAVAAAVAAWLPGVLR